MFIAVGQQGPTILELKGCVCGGGGGGDVCTGSTGHMDGQTAVTLKKVKK